jgi:hypothetical protein
MGGVRAARGSPTFVWQHPQNTMAAVDGVVAAAEAQPWWGTDNDPALPAPSSSHEWAPDVDAAAARVAEARFAADVVCLAFAVTPAQAPLKTATLLTAAAGAARGAVLWTLHRYGAALTALGGCTGPAAAGSFDIAAARRAQIAHDALHAAFQRGQLVPLDAAARRSSVLRAALVAVASARPLGIVDAPPPPLTADELAAAVRAALALYVPPAVAAFTKAHGPAVLAPPGTPSNAAWLLSQSHVGQDTKDGIYTAMRHIAAGTDRNRDPAASRVYVVVDHGADTVTWFRTCDAASAAHVAAHKAYETGEAAPRAGLRAVVTIHKLGMLQPEPEVRL